MVTEGYSPSVIYLQDLGLLSYSRHRPLERANWASPFLVRHSGSGCSIGPASLLWPSGWASIFKPHQLPPSPCVRTAWARAIIVSVSIAISTCRFGLALIAAISRVLIMILWDSRLTLPFLTTASISRSSGLLAFYLFGVFVLRFLLDFRWVLGFSRVFLVYTVCFCDGLESLFILAYLC